MVELKVRIDTVDNVKKFVNTVSKYNFDVNLISGRYSVDAKSIMGIFSVDLSKELVLKAHTDDEALVKADMTDYMVS